MSKQINLNLAYGRTYNKKRLLFLRWFGGFNSTICIACTPNNAKYTRRVRLARRLNFYQLNQYYFQDGSK